MKKRKLKKKFKLTFTLLFIITVVYFGFKFYDNKTAFTEINIPVINEQEKNEQEKNEQKKEAWPKTYKINLLATGDGLIHNTVYEAAKKSDGTYDFSDMLTEVKDIVSKYDIAYYNQETVFGGASLGYGSYPRFNTPSEYGDAMLDIGFNTVSLASNHSMDYGTKAALNSVNYWKNTDALYNGMATNEDERNNFIIKEKNGITYTMLSYTYGTNGLSVPSDMPYLVNLYSYEQAKKDIESIRDKVDVLIVAMHWGQEYQLTANETQKREAKELASLGVDIIIGNHSHCLQPIETINNTLVIYSLGNFISNQTAIIDSIGYKGIIGAFVYTDIIKTLNQDGTSSISVENTEAELIFTYRSLDKKTFKVVPFSKMNTNYLSNYKEVYEEYKKVLTKYDNNIKIYAAA